MRGLTFTLPEDVRDKNVSAVEVGPHDETGLAREINKFLGTNIEGLARIDTYLLVHPQELQPKELESLLFGKPFVDPVIHRATLNRPLVKELGIPFDYVLQSMLNPGTSDAEGDTALRQTLLALGKPFSDGDAGFYSKQYFLRGRLNQKQLEDVSAFLANPELYGRLIIPRQEYESGKKVTVPIVTLKPETRVETFDIVSMSDEQLLELNSRRKLAATLEELYQFRDMYRDEEFLKKRRELGLDEKATDVELETWFGLRSEHCFHKEFNAHLTLEDKTNDPIFRRAYERGLLAKDDNGNYVLERGMFKTFVEEPARVIFNRLEKRGKNWIASMFEDNSGVVFYNEDYMFCIKVETHNSPANIEPVQGAKTGINGANRDPMGTERGTFELIANLFWYCTGNPSYRGWLPQGVKHPYTILKGITQGVREGGNEMQIPTLGGGLITDPRYIAKCLVYCGTTGWSPVKSVDGISYVGKDHKKGDLIFVAGQPVGIDGVHGATESSLSAGSHISLGHVQADFSFIQAKLKEYILSVARDNMLSGITDCGGMGLGSAAEEIARKTGGLIMDLSLHPVKYKGIQPWQINCSETQDRMLLIAPEESKYELFRKSKLHEVEITQLGELTDSGYVHLKYKDRTVALIDIKKLFDKEPRKHMHATWYKAPEEKTVSISPYSLEESLCLVMSQPDVASKEWFFRQKDSSVKGGTIQSPLIGLRQEIESDTTIQKPLDTEGKDFGALAYAMGIAPKLSDSDPYYAVQKSFVDMVGKIIAIGGTLPDMENPRWDAWAVCGNYCQPNSDSNTTLTRESGEHNLASLIREGMGVRDTIEKLNIPVISGKDSMKCSCAYEVGEDFELEDVPPDLRGHIALVENKNGKRFIEIHDPDSYLASAAVKIEDYRKCVNPAFKQEGDLIYVIGTTRNHLGASQLLSATGYKEQGAPIQGGIIPKVDFDEFANVARAIHAATDGELVASCSYTHNGGLAVSLSKAALAGELGANIDARQISNDGNCTYEELLYSETPGRFVVTIAPEDKERFEQIVHSVPYSMIGRVTKKDLCSTRLDGAQEYVSLDKVKEAYQKPLRFGLDVKVN